jgi:hypothetical protein
MGTSRNDPSPNTPPWRMARAALGREQIGPERQVEALWRAAAADRGERLESAFAEPVLASACAIVEGASSVIDALNGFDSLVAERGAAGLAVDMGRRALARATAKGGTAAEFAGELFAEAASYYAARDLPSFIGAPGRVQSAAESLQLKSELRRVTKEVVSQIGKPSTDPEGWRQYVGGVLNALTGRGGRQ